ncbi:MAG: DUF2029 domain-containing protein [Solirubrobacteraceae bacterium]|nr:DUF2029 domain-containing protein [Solirubrobacteraceae bacterium]
MGNRRTLALLAVGMVTTTLLAAVGLDEVRVTDYQHEARPAYDALIAGDVSGFFAHLPAYAGTLLLHAPVALLAGSLGGSAQVVFTAVAVPALIGLLALSVWLATTVPGRGGWVVLGVATLNPIAYQALDYGHPEEILVGVLSVAAVLVAQRERPVLAGVMLGLAIVAKPWALLAVGPVLLALPRGQVRALLATGAIGVVFTLPVLLFGGTATRIAPHTGTVFHPWQLWWFFGDGGSPANGIEGYRDAPAWIVSLTHPLIVLLGFALSAVWARRGRDRTDAVGLLAFLLLMRCVLDPWNNPYYELPFLLALLAWECARGARFPFATVTLTLLAWLTFVTAPKYVLPDVYCALFLAWSLPTLLTIGALVYAPDRTRALFARLRERLPDGDTKLTLRRSAPSTGR